MLSLIVAIPSVAQVGVIVLLIYFIFGVFFLSFLSGQLRACTLPFKLTSQQYAPQNELLQWPIAWADYSDVQRSWFAPGNNYTSVYQPSPYILIILISMFPYTNSAGNVTCSSWPSQPCCSANNAGLKFKLTSRFICECWGGSWDPLTDFRFEIVVLIVIKMHLSMSYSYMMSTFDNIPIFEGLTTSPCPWFRYLVLQLSTTGPTTCIS